MNEINYDYPFIYLLEFHIGDGYFDRQSNGDYTVLVNYRCDTNILVKEKERGDDRLVKFRQGKSVIFGITKPNDELQIIFQALDSGQEIGKSSIYFLGHGSPINLAEKSFTSATASVVRTNLQLSHGAGSLQVFARLTCFGTNLLTDFSVSGNVNTEFDTYINDIELAADESFTKCRFEIGDVEDSKDFECKLPEKINDLTDLLKKIDITSDTELNASSTLCFYEISPVVEDDSDEYLKDTILQRNNLQDNVEDMVASLVDNAIDICAMDGGGLMETRTIRNLDDLMFTTYTPVDEINVQSNITNMVNLQSTLNVSKFSLNADASVLDLTECDVRMTASNGDITSEESEEESVIEAGGVCIESKIGDVPSTININGIENEKKNKTEEEIVKTTINIDEENDDKRTEKLPPSETGDAPEVIGNNSETESLNDEEKSQTSRRGRKRRKNQAKEIDTPPPVEQIPDDSEKNFQQEVYLNDEKNVKNTPVDVQEQHAADNHNNSRRRYAKGKRRSYK